MVEGLNGDLRICDGHRRWRAAQLAGLTVPAWVSPLCPSRLDGKPLVATGLTYELALLGAYADGRTVPLDQVKRIQREVAAAQYTSVPEQFPDLLAPDRPVRPSPKLLLAAAGA